MTWEDILKQDVISQLEELKDFANFKGRFEGKLRADAYPQEIALKLNDNFIQLKGKIDDKLFRDLQKQIRNISNKSDDLGVAFGVFADIIDDYLEEREPRPPSSSYNPNPELRALDRSPPASYYED